MLDLPQRLHAGQRRRGAAAAATRLGGAASPLPFTKTLKASPSAPTPGRDVHTPSRAIPGSANREGAALERKAFSLASGEAAVVDF